MLYGTVRGPSTQPGSEATINFGASPFVFNPAAVLGTSAAGLEPRWGAP